MPERTPLQGPCGNPACPNPTSSAGQWKLIPEDNTRPARDGATCLCKRDEPCRLYFGLPPLQPAARKRAALEARCGTPDVAVGLALKEEPRPPFIVKIEEIWGVRYTHQPASPRFPLHRVYCRACPGIATWQ